MTKIEDTNGPRLELSIMPACLSLSTYCVKISLERVRGFLLADLAVNQNRTPGNNSFRCASETSNSSQNVRKDGRGGCMSGHVKVEGGVKYSDESVKVERGV